MQEIKSISAYKQGLRDRILGTAMKLFTTKGIRAVKMDDIAMELSISKRTLYEVYENKEVLLLEGVKKRHEQLERQFIQIGEGSANVMEIMLKVYRLKVEEFRLTSPSFYSDLAKYPQVLRLLNKLNLRTRGSYLKFLDRGMEEGFFRSDVNYELAGRMFDALGHYVMTQELYKLYSIEEIFNNLIFVSLRGFCTAKGVTALDKISGLE